MATQKHEILPQEITQNAYDDNNVGAVEPHYIFSEEAVERASGLVRDHSKQEELEERIRLHWNLVGIIRASLPIVEIPRSNDLSVNAALEEQFARSFSEEDVVGALKTSTNSAVDRISEQYSVNTSEPPRIFEDSHMVASLLDQATQHIRRKDQQVKISKTPQPEEVVNDVDIAERMEAYAPVKYLPRLREQIEDKSRTALFAYEVRDKRNRVKRKGTMTEHEGLSELGDFLTQVDGLSSVPEAEFDGRYPDIRKEVTRREKKRLIRRLGTRKDLKDSNLDDLEVNTTEADIRRKIIEEAREKFDSAKGILENLSYIGDKEFREAVHGLGIMWKAYLDEDSSRKLCLLTGVGELERYQGTRKSDDYLREKILESFSDEELAKYSGRIVANVKDLDQAQPENVRVVMLDDWTVSGNQMRDTYSKYMENPVFRKYAQAGSVEINLLVASQDRFENGLRIDSADDLAGSIPVRAYYLSHDAHGTAISEHESHVSGIYSSVNYDFRNECYQMARFFKLEQPGITSVAREYHDTKPRINISKTAIKRINSRGRRSFNRKPGLIRWQ